MYAVLHHQVIVGKVLENEAKCKYKQKAALAFCNSRFCRRKKNSKLQCCYIYQSKKSAFYKVFAKSPCVAYLNLRSSEFVAKFMQTKRRCRDTCTMRLFC